tara:strand:- start:269 stop:691 length:423 start_codon:yes stop_codon:yes gene_type:complete
MQARLQGNKRLGKRSGRLSLTPLIDCVFILLVFFMLQTNFLRPRAIEFSQSASSSQINTETPLIAIELRLDGSVWLNGAGSSLEGLKTYAGSLTDPSQSRVMLAVDPKVKLQSAVDIMDMLNESQIFNISLAATRRFEDD